MNKKLSLAPRKQPKQARSTQMRADILEAAIRVLRRDGLPRLTTPRVAEVAGVSVGSLYQYFPNKQAILYAIHSQTVNSAWTAVQRILESCDHDGRTKVRLIAAHFFHAETDDVRTMGPTVHAIDQYLEADSTDRLLDLEVLRRFTVFVRGELPRGTSKARVTFATRLLLTTLESVGKSVGQQQLPPRDVEVWAVACADMLTGFLGFSSKGRRR